MTTIRQLMSNDHRHCDDLFAAVEEAIAAKQLEPARLAFHGFQQAMLTHFSGEEEILFPGFEASTGMTHGPTHMMRLEHAQIRSLLDEAVEALANDDVEAYLGTADTLIIMLQQHNMKEENILYPMCDQHLLAEAAEIIKRLEAELAHP